MNFATLDLINQYYSDFDYTIIKNPDGHQNIQIRIEGLPIGPKVSHLVTIKTRIKSFGDLELLICSIKSLRNIGFRNIELYSPYISGIAFDDDISLGKVRYLKEVMGPILNSLNFSSIISLSNNSRVLENFLYNFENIDLDRFLSYSLSQIYFSGEKNVKDNSVIITTDSNYANKIINSIKILEPETIRITYPVFDPIEQKINSFDLDLDNLEQKDVIIIADICKSGNKFIDLVKKLSDRNINNKYLIVNHGIFSNGFTELDLHFNKIFCTNSFSDLDGTYNLSKEKINGIPVKEIHELVTQFDIFAN